MPNIVGHLVLNEVPRQSDDMVIAQIPFRAVPREQASLRVQYGVVPWQLGVHEIVLLCHQRARQNQAGG